MSLVDLTTEVDPADLDTAGPDSSSDASPQRRALAELWRARYGGLEPTAAAAGPGAGPSGGADDPAGAAVRLQLAHRSVRQYLPDDVSDETLATLVAAAQSAATSSNLQLWSVVAVRDPQRRARLAHLAGDQAHIVQAPLLLVWLVDLARAHAVADRHEAPTEASDYLETTVVGFVDAALAAQNATLAAESLGLGTVYIGALRNDPAAVAEVLGLPDHVFAAFGLVVGHPDPDERATVKPRLAQDAVLHHETYDATRQLDAVSAYEHRIGAYYAAQGLQHSWTQRLLARLAHPRALNGRERLTDALGAAGLGLR